MHPGILFALALSRISAGWAMEYSELPPHLQACTACHDPSGISQNKLFPNLASQRNADLVNQLEAFRDKSRNDPDALVYMQNQAASLSDDDIRIAADYFSSQPARARDPEDPGVIEKGRAIFETGIPSKQVPACAPSRRGSSPGLGISGKVCG